MASLVEMVVALLLAALVAAVVTWLLVSISPLLAVIVILIATVVMAVQSCREPDATTDGHTAGQPGPYQPPSHNIDWARRKLPPDAYEEITNEYKVRCVRLTRDTIIDGVHCKGGTQVYFSLHGELTLATLATDQDIEELPLAAGTTVCWTTEPHGLVSATLRRDTWIDGIPCAAGPLRLHSGYRRHVRSTQLFCEMTVAGMRCAAQSRLELDRGLFGYKLRYCVPVEETTQWGLRCAAGKGIDFYEQSGTLAQDIERAGVIIPRGSRFCHDIDWAFLSVTLPRGGAMVFGHHLPEGFQLSFWRKDDGTKRRWWEHQGPELPVVCGGYLSEPWMLAGHFPIEAQQYVRLSADGAASTTLKKKLTVSGVSYAANSCITVDTQGQIIRFSVPTGPRAAHGGPYRSPERAS